MSNSILAIPIFIPHKFIFNMNRIKEVLQEKGIKQVWLSEKLEKSLNMVNEYCNNRRQPSLEDLYKIAEILEVKPKDLLKDKV